MGRNTNYYHQIQANNNTIAFSAGHTQSNDHHHVEDEEKEDNPLQPHRDEHPQQHVPLAGQEERCSQHSGVIAQGGKHNAYLVGIGLLIYAIRRWGAYADGVAFAVLLMNMAVPVIDHFTIPRIVGHPKGREKQ